MVETHPRFDPSRMDRMAEYPYWTILTVHFPEQFDEISEFLNSIDRQGRSGAETIRAARYSSYDDVNALHRFGISFDEAAKHDPSNTIFVFESNSDLIEFKLVFG